MVRRFLGSTLLALVFACQNEQLSMVAPLPDREVEPADGGSALADGDEPLPEADAGDRTPDAAEPADAGERVADAETSPDAEPQLIGERCFPEIFDPNVAGPNYDQYSPSVG